jgi:hypothetical protein
MHVAMRQRLASDLALGQRVFSNDTDGPSPQAEYEGATKVIEHYLGIRQSK